jgi:hypothetical protein
MTNEERAELIELLEDDAEEFDDLGTPHGDYAAKLLRDGAQRLRGELEG